MLLYVCAYVYTKIIALKPKGHIDYRYGEYVSLGVENRSHEARILREAMRSVYVRKWYVQVTCT